MYLTKKDFPVDTEDQSTEIPESGGIRQSKLNPVGVRSKYFYDDAKTIAEVLQKGCKISNNGPCLGWRDSKTDYKWLTYEEVIQKSRNISSGMVSSGIKPGQGTYIGIYAQNCVEWVLVEHACYCQSYVTVPLYESFGIEALSFILKHVEAEVVVCDTEKKVISLLEASEEFRHLKQVIAIQKVSEQLKKIADQKGIALHQLNDIEELGKRTTEALKLPSPSDLATVCYTSGTTGNPKGVMITHGNVVVNASAMLKHLGSNYIGVGDRHISFLPLSHMLERHFHVICFSSGASIGFFRGDVTLLSDDIRILKPTMMVTVPRVLNKIYDKVQKEANSSKIKKVLLNAAIRAKQEELERGLIRNNSVWDVHVLKNIRSELGGKVRLLLTSGAPIRDEVLLFFRCCLGCPVIQTYGQTETAGSVCANVIGEYSGGSNGPPLPCYFVKLIDVPEKNFYAQKGEGEVLIKGSTMPKGYFKDPSRTAELLDEDGWLHSGDIGRWLQNGSLAIIDRKKNILKLSQGEYVSPEKVETVYMASPYVEQIFVHGDSLENFLVGIVVPNKEELLLWCSESNIRGEWNNICQNKIVAKHILHHMHQLGHEAGLKGFEQVKAIYLHPEAFTRENGLLTTTMKAIRMEFRKRFKDIIEDMYKN